MLKVPDQKIKRCLRLHTEHHPAIVDDAVDCSNGSSDDNNFNGIPDECDIADGTSQDADGNGIPDECEVVSGFMVITGVVDGPLSGGTPKAIELYVLSDIPDFQA